MTAIPDLGSYAADCRAWLADRLPPRRSDGGPPSRAIFVDHTDEQERALIAAARAWQATKYDAGYGAPTRDPAWGGAGLDPAHERVLARVEQEFAVPQRHELLEITVGLVAPTVLTYGDDGQRNRHVRAFLRADELCCQLFSEPGAGSDLAAIATRARPGDDGTWSVDGQKVWTSGAQFADWGFLIARTEPDAPKHRGLTAFLVRMDSPGITTRPIRQMSGGSSFNEVFLSDVAVPDSCRIGDRGQGWKVALTLLSHERSTSAGVLGIGGKAADLPGLAVRCGTADDPVVATRVGQALARERAAALLGRRHAERDAAGTGDPIDGSLGKLVWSQNLTLVGTVAAEILGDRICADTGEDDTFAWSEHLLGAPGFRIAGGSDEIQRNLVGERGLGLPREPS